MEAGDAVMVESHQTGLRKLVGVWIVREPRGCTKAELLEGCEQRLLRDPRGRRNRALCGAVVGDNISQNLGQRFQVDALLAVLPLHLLCWSGSTTSVLLLVVLRP